MRIEVTAEDIEAGEPESFEGCPIARAAARASGTPKVMALGSLYFYPLDGTEIRRSVPRECHEFMECFDAGLIVAPFTFEVADL